MRGFSARNIEPDSLVSRRIVIHEDLASPSSSSYLTENQSLEIKHSGDADGNGLEDRVQKLELEILATQLKLKEATEMMSGKKLVQMVCGAINADAARYLPKLAALSSDLKEFKGAVEGGRVKGFALQMQDMTGALAPASSYRH